MQAEKPYSLMLVVFQGELSGFTFRVAHLESLNQKLTGAAEEKQIASQSAVKEIEQLKEKLK